MRPSIRPRRRHLPVFLAGVFALFGAAATATAAPADDATTLRARALADWHAGDRLAAAERWSKVARQAADPALWTMVGDMKASARRPAEAAEAWGEALALSPADPDVLDRLAQVQIIRGDWAAASSAQRRLVQALAAAAGARPGAERTELSSGRRVSLADSHLWHLDRLAHVAAMAGDFTTAEEAARALIRRAPEAVGGYLALGHVFQQAGEHAAAADAFRDALSIDGHDPAALNNLGTALYMDGDLKAADRLFEAVLGSPARTPYIESIALSNLAELHLLAARHDSAGHLYDQAVEAFPRGAWSYMGRAALLDVLGRYDEAIDAMIDGWERDANRATRLNMYFVQPEWGWQRDALIAEIEGEPALALELWTRVAEGDVAPLRASAADHMASLKRLLAD